MKLQTLLYFAVLISPSLLACVETPVVDLSHASREILVEQLGRDFPDVDIKASIRGVQSYGYDVAHYAQVEFLPHRHESGADHYYVVGCKYLDSGEWSCGQLEERREVSIENPADRVRLSDGVVADVAIRIIDSIRGTLFVNQKGRYSYSRYGENQVSSVPLDLTLIYLNYEGKYAAIASAKGACAVHQILVQEIACGLGECAFEVIENEVFHGA